MAQSTIAARKHEKCVYTTRLNRNWSENGRVLAVSGSPSQESVRSHADELGRAKHGAHVWVFCLRSFAPFSIQPRSVRTSLVFASRDGRLSHPSLYHMPTCYWRMATTPEERLSDDPGHAESLPRFNIADLLDTWFLSREQCSLICTLLFKICYKAFPAVGLGKTQKIVIL